MSTAGHRPAPIDEDARRRFEDARRAGIADGIESYLPEESDPSYLPTLVELVVIEMELSWKRMPQADAPGDRTTVLPPGVDDFLVRFPVLHEPAIAAELLQEEYRARCRRGVDPGAHHYRQRLREMFPGHPVPE